MTLRRRSGSRGDPDRLPFRSIPDIPSSVVHLPRFSVVLAAAAAAPVLLGAAPWFSSGPPAGYSSGPGNYSNCTDCHVGTVNSGTGSLSLANAPDAWQPGVTYALSLTLDDPNATRWGFELSAQHPDGGQAGTLVVTDPVETQLLSFQGVEYLEHTSQGTAPGTSGGHTWSFEWTAPAAGAGKAVIYVSGNAANGNSNTLGDLIYTMAVPVPEGGGTLPEAAVAAIPETIFPRRGASWNVRIWLRNVTASTQAPFVVSRIRLPNGNVFPSTGWLYGPTQVTLAPGELRPLDVIHLVPATAPLVSATYEILVGGPGNPMDSYAFDFTVVP